MSATLYTFLGDAPGPRVAAAANTANLLAAAGDDVVLLDLQPRAPPPPVGVADGPGLADALADERPVDAALAPVEDAPTGVDRSGAGVTVAGRLSLLPLSKPLTPVVAPEDDPADAAARVLDGLAGFDAVCAVAPPLPDLVGIDPLWVATLNRAAVRSTAVVGVLPTADHAAAVEELHGAERGGVPTDCALAVQPTASHPPPTVVRDPDYPLRGRVPAPDWPDAAADAYREFTRRLTDRTDLAGLGTTPPTLVDPGTVESRPDRRVATDGAGTDGDPDRRTAAEDTRWDDGWTLGDAGDATETEDESEGGGRLRGLFR
jgi:hypothetical protein